MHLATLVHSNHVIRIIGVSRGVRFVKGRDYVKGALCQGGDLSRGKLCQGGNHPLPPLNEALFIHMYYFTKP